MSTAPSERRLLTVERDLKKKPAGAQKAVSEGIYMRLDRTGSRRFHVRGRGTYDTWEAAEDARIAVAAEDTADGGSPTVAQMRTWTIKRYAQE